SHLTITDKARNDVPFLFNPIQNAYYANRTKSDLILKARKEGISALISAIWLHACLVTRNTRAVIVSHTEESAKHLFSRVDFYLKHMPKIPPSVLSIGEESKTQVSFP